LVENTKAFREKYVEGTRQNNLVTSGEKGATAGTKMEEATVY